MSAFQVNLTPTRVKNGKLQELRTPIDVVMAPFSAKSIVQFDGVPVTKTAKRILRITNPSEQCIKVMVTKQLKPDHNVSLSWTESTVPACDHVDMEMVWMPQLEVACMETLQLTDDRNFRKDVSIILKSKGNKLNKNVRKFPTVSSGANAHAKTMRLKSPKGAVKVGKSVLLNPQRKRSPLKNDRHLCVANAGMHTQELNAETLQRMKKGTSPLQDHNVVCTYFGAKDNMTAAHTPLQSAGLDVCDHKENISPTTPLNMLSALEKMRFTPVTETLSKAPHLTDLASLPTPVSCDYDLDSLRKEIRPRRLTSMDLIENETTTKTQVCGEDMMHETLSNTIATGGSNNKTFEVKLVEDSNTSNMDTSLNVSYGPNAMLCTEVVNRTTTVACTPYARALEIIREEDSFCTSGISVRTDLKIDETYDKLCCDSASAIATKSPRSVLNLKRDIKLVGSPLRKYSESMVELTIKSPSSSRFCIQGSMPNLNEMESIRSIEQNRYFHQSSTSTYSNNPTTCKDTTTRTFATNAKHLNISIELLNDSEACLVSNADGLFNQNEILAQSSRFNLNELSSNTCRNSPQTTIIQLECEKCPDSINVSNSKDSSSLKRKSFDLSFSDSPSTDSLVNADNNATMHTLKVPLKSFAMKISPPKRQRVNNEFSFARPASVLTPTNASAARNKSWCQVKPKKLKLSKTLSLVKRPITPRRVKEEPRVKLYDTDYYLQSCVNPDAFSATMTCDPFLASTMYLDEGAVDRHQTDFKKWLNALVSLPPEFDTDNNTRIDVGKLFSEVRHKQLQLAPTKEEQSLNYITQFRLESLRRVAVQLYMSEEMRVPCSKVVVYVNKNALQIRSDRNLHLDVVMQRNILELLLCFNPLWLRLGLEVVFGEKIHLQSNSDIIGLSTFILNRLFRDKFLEQKYSRAYTLSDEYASHIKKFTLQKMLLLLLFLDKAKQARIIRHNPCLFAKKSPFKQTKDILLRFSSELLANIGDITRDLKRLGYVLQHKQNFLDEFDYAFNNLAVDLRDGVRLTRVMEVILLRDDLSRQLRVPAISRLQRVHNVNVALRALADADFQLGGDINAADIVDGHREKTLSLLWQIVYKFRSPKFHAAARTLQAWWRHQWLKVFIKRRICERIERRHRDAAIRIQSAFRGFITRKYTAAYRAERTQAAIVLQTYWRRHRNQQQLRHTILAVRCIQRWYRSHRETRRCRLAYMRLQTCVVFLQRCYRRRLMSTKLLAVAQLAVAVRAQRREMAAVCIQQWWRAYLQQRPIRLAFERLRSAAIVVQCRYRAKCVRDQQQLIYERLRYASLVVQRRFRANREMRLQRQRYREEIRLIVAVQRRWRSTLAMTITRAIYTRQRSAAIVLQRRWRATVSMRTQRAEYLKTLNATAVLQRRWRAQLAMRAHRQQYQRLRACTVRLQRQWHATCQSRHARDAYLQLRSCTVRCQRRYRGKLCTRAASVAYQRLRAAVIMLQRRRRATLAVRKERACFLVQREAILKLQRFWRARKVMRYTCAKYRGTRNAVTCLQQHWRAVLSMRQQRAAYLRIRDATCVLQQAWRATMTMREHRSRYLQLQSTAIYVQRRYRANVLMRTQVAVYRHERSVIIAFQLRWRATLQTRRDRRQYERVRGAVVLVQQQFLSLIAMRRQRVEYQHCRTAIVQLQRRWKARQQMRLQYATYQQQRAAAIHVQRWYRSVHLMRITRASYQRQRTAAVVLQQRYRSYRSAKQVRAQYLLIRSLIVCVQRKFRALLAMRADRIAFLTLRRTVVEVQQRYRGRSAMRRSSATFQQLRHGTVRFQAHFRGYLARQRFRALMTPAMVELLRQKRAALVIQRWWRGYRIRKQFHDVRLSAIRENLSVLRTCASAVNSVRYKLKHAVHLLRGRSNVSECLVVLMQLERLSRTVPHLLMDHSSYISSFCYGIMSQAIRSEADKQMIEHCSCIILNLARYNSTTANTFQRGGLTTIAQMLLRWCDKDTNIFNTLCTLVWIFAHCPVKREIIREFMTTTTEAIYFMRETKKLVLRKEKMNQNRQRSTVQQQQQQNQRKINFPSRVLPSLEPDYGIIRNHPYTFISSVYAYDVVLHKLGIHLY